MNDKFYRAFEDRYRGSRESIRSRLSVYLPFLRPLKDIYRECKVLDLGCGRGEWLQLLSDEGFEAFGVDLDTGMLEACREHGLAVERADALTYLESVPDESLAVVSGFHFAEHIPFETLQEVVGQALRTLKPAGLLILETPNPENLAVGTNNFYLDPTHQRPLPPLLLSFLSEYSGFQRTKVLRLQESAKCANGAADLEDVIFGASQDYAIVAQKAGTTAQLALFDDYFQKNYGLSLGTLASHYDESMSSKLTEILQSVDQSAELQRQVHQREAELDQAQRQLSVRESELAQVRDQLAALHASLSWRVTAPLRVILGAILGVFGYTKRLPGQAASKAKTWLTRRFLQVAAYVAARPTLNSKVQRLLTHFPTLHARLLGVTRPASEARGVSGVLAEPRAGPLAVTELDGLTAAARDLHRDLMAALAQERGNRHTEETQQ